MGFDISPGFIEKIAPMTICSGPYPGILYEPNVVASTVSMVVLNLFASKARSLPSVSASCIWLISISAFFSLITRGSISSFTSSSGAIPSSYLSFNTATTKLLPISLTGETSPTLVLSLNAQ